MLFIILAKERLMVLDAPQNMYKFFERLISMNKFLLSLSIIMLIILSLFVTRQPLLSSDQEDDEEVDGVITVTGTNNVVATAGEGFVLKDLATSPPSIVDPGSVVIPTQAYQMSLDLSQLDGLDDFSKITFMFLNQNHPDLRESFDLYESTGIREKVTGYENNPFILSDDAFIVEWTPEEGFVQVGGESTTWTLDTSSSAMTSLSSTRFRFDVDFEVSKVAMQNNVWHIAALIEDGVVSEAPTQTFVSNGPYRMAFYGEVAVPQNAQVLWDGVNPGSSFFQLPNNSALISSSGGAMTVGLDVNFLANGFFQQRAKSSAQWQADIDPLPTREDNLAFLVTDNALAVEDFNPQQFAILAGFNGEGVNDNLAQIGTSFVTFRGHRLTNFTSVVPDEWRSRTPEGGRDFNDIAFFVAIAPEFQNARYQGLITVGISNETDIVQLTVSEIKGLTSNLSTQGVIGVFAETEAELEALLESSHVDVPIYLKNGFLTIESESFSIDAVGNKKVIGDLFVTGDQANLSNFTMHFGQLHVLGDQVTLNNLSIRSASPGGDLIVMGDDLEATQLLIDGDLKVMNATGSGVLKQSGLSGTVVIGGHVTVINSTFEIRNYVIRGNLESGLGHGDITVSEGSHLILRDGVRFNQLNLTQSTSEFFGVFNTRPVGNQMNLDQSDVTWQHGNVGKVVLNNESTFEKNDGLTDTIELNEESHLDFNDGKTWLDVLINNSTAHFLNGEVGFLGDTSVLLTPTSSWQRGIIVDRSSISGRPASLVTVSGVNTTYLWLDNEATVMMTSGTVERVAQLNAQTSMVLSGGVLKNTRLYNGSVVTMSGGESRSTHAFNDSELTVSGGTLGSTTTTDVRVVMSDRATLTMTAGELRLNEIISSVNVVTQLLENNSEKRGFIIRDDAVATLSSSVTIATHSELEMRDNATLTAETSSTFNRSIRDHSTAFNEHDGEGSNVNFNASRRSEIFFYVRPEGGTTRTARETADQAQVIDFDFNFIEGENSALAEARRLSEAFTYINPTIYLYPGEYLETATIELDVQHVALNYVSSRSNLRNLLATTGARFGSTKDSASQATLTTNITIKNDISATIHGIHLNVTDHQPLTFGERSMVTVENSFIHQIDSSMPIIDSKASQITIRGNYITRSQTNGSPNLSVGVLLDGLGSFGNVIELNRINNIESDAVVVKNSTLASISVRSNQFNESSGGRPIEGHAFVLRDSSLSGQLTFNSNFISEATLDALHVINTTFGGHVNIRDNDIRNIRHAIYFDGQTSFSAAHDIRVGALGFSGRPFRGTGSAIYFDGVDEIHNLLINKANFSDFMHGLNIQNAQTVQSINVIGGEFKDMTNHAFNIVSNEISDVRFSYQSFSDDFEKLGHNLNNNLLSSNTPNFTVGLIQDIAKTAINIEASSLDGFYLNGFTINRFALDGEQYAGVDFNVETLKNININQALYERYIYSNGSLFFNRYQAVQMTFSGGQGAALRFHLGDAFTYENNRIMQPRIVDNAVGIEFVGSLTSSNPIVKIFGTFDNLVLSPQEGSLKAFVETTGAYTFPSNNSVDHELDGKMTDNTIELIDFSRSLSNNVEEFQLTYDFLLEVRNHYDNFGYGEEVIERLTVISLDRDGIEGLALKELEGLTTIDPTLFEHPMKDRDGRMLSEIYVEATERSPFSLNVNAIGTTNDTGDTFLGKEAQKYFGDTLPKDDRYVYLPITLAIPEGMEESDIRIVSYLETSNGDAVELVIPTCFTDCVDRDAGVFTIEVPIAIVSGQAFGVIPDDSVFHFTIEWDDQTTTVQKAYVISYSTTTQTYLSVLKAASNEDELKSLMETQLTNQVSAIMEETFYDILFANLELDTSNSVSTIETFNDLFYESRLIEIRRLELISYIADSVTQSSINTPAAIDTIFPEVRERLTALNERLNSASVVLSVEGVTVDREDLQSRISALDLNEVNEDQKIAILVAFEGLIETNSLTVANVLNEIEQVISNSN